MSQDSGTAVAVEERKEVLPPEEVGPRPEESGAGWTRWEVLAFALIILAALGLRLWDLGAKALHHDESLHALYSWYIYDGRVYLHDPMMHGPFQFFGTSAIYWLLGDGNATARLLPALFGTVLVGVPLLLRRHLGRAGTMVTSLLLALSPTMLYFSRFARNDMYMAVWALLLVAFMWRYLDTRKIRYLLLSSVALAFAFATKETVYILVAVVGSYLVFAAATDVVPWLMGRRRLSSFSPQGELLVLLATFSLPLGVAGIALFQSTLGITLANPDWTTGPVGYPKGPGLYVAFFAVVGALVAAVGVGLRWRPWTWLACFGAFATVWGLLYSSFFTNYPGGLLSGLWRSLGYWVVQQEVARGGQPWYYYIVLGLNYESLPMLVGTVAAAYYLLKGDRFSLFLAYWAMANFVLYTYAAEKMPWLLVNVALPFILLAGKALGRLLEQQPWRQDFGSSAPADATPLNRLRSINWPAVAFTMMLALFLAVGGRWLTLALPKESGLSGRLEWLLAFLVPAMAVACLYLLGQAGPSMAGVITGARGAWQGRAKNILDLCYISHISLALVALILMGTLTIVSSGGMDVDTAGAIGTMGTFLSGLPFLVGLPGFFLSFVMWRRHGPVAFLSLLFVISMFLLFAVAGEPPYEIHPVGLTLGLAYVALSAYFSMVWFLGRGAQWVSLVEKDLVGWSGKGKRLALVVVSLAGVMLALSVHSAFRVTYANPDVPVEMLVYTQTAPDIPQIMAQIERLGQQTGKGRDLKITVDSTDGFSWPWAWYLRDYKYVGYPCYGGESSCREMAQTPDADVVLLAASNQPTAERFMSAYGIPVRYRHRWWFPESYRGLTPRTLWEGLRQRESWCKVVDYFLYRDFGQPVRSVDAYAYFPKGFALMPVGRDVSGMGTRC